MRDVVEPARGSDGFLEGVNAVSGLRRKTVLRALLRPERLVVLGPRLAGAKIRPGGVNGELDAAETQRLAQAQPVEPTRAIT